MSFNPSFTTKKDPITYPIDSEEIPERLYAFNQLSATLIKNPKSAHISFLCQQMRELHALRAKFPQQENILCASLFNVFEQIKKQPDDFAIQSVSIALFNGFLDTPPQNIQTTQKVCQAIQSSVNPKNLRSLLQRLVGKLSEHYSLFKEADTDLALAKKIKECALFSLQAHKKITATDKNWIHNIAQNLAYQHPTAEFQELAQQFPPQRTLYTGNKVKLPKDAEITYNFESPFKPNIFPKYDRD